MSDLISRDKAITAVLGTSIEYQLIYGKKEPKEGFVRSLIKSIANIPQEESERKIGKWDMSHASVYIKCSVCGEPFMMMPQNYCPNCGAKMEAGHE